MRPSFPSPLTPFHSSPCPQDQLNQYRQRVGLFQISNTITNNLFPQNQKGNNGVAIHNKRTLKHRQKRMKQQEQTINKFQENKKKGSKNQKDRQRKQNQLSNIALLKQEVQGIQRKQSEGFRWDSIVDNKKISHLIPQRTSKPKQIRGIQLLHVQDILNENNKVLALKQFNDSFGFNIQGTSHSQRKNRSYLTKKPSLRRSSTNTNNATIAFLQNDKDDSKEILNRITINSSQPRKEVYFPFSKYFIANKAKRRSICTSHISGRAIKRHNILADMKKTL